MAEPPTSDAEDVKAAGKRGGEIVVDVGGVAQSRQEYQGPSASAPVEHFDRGIRGDPHHPRSVGGGITPWSRGFAVGGIGAACSDTRAKDQRPVDEQVSNHPPRPLPPVAARTPVTAPPPRLAAPVPSTPAPDPLTPPACGPGASRGR